MMLVPPPPLIELSAFISGRTISTSAAGCCSTAIGSGSGSGSGLVWSGLVPSHSSNLDLVPTRRPLPRAFTLTPLGGPTARSHFASYVMYFSRAGLDQAGPPSGLWLDQLDVDLRAPELVLSSPPAAALLRWLAQSRRRMSKSFVLLSAAPPPPLFLFHLLKKSLPKTTRWERHVTG